MLLITGTPRSATGYMAKIFTYAGIPCGHEQKYNIDHSQFLHKVPKPTAESSWLAVPNLQKHKNIIHITRDPLKVISSMMKANFLEDNKPDLDFVEKTLPKIKKYNGIERYVYFWTEWNSLIEKHTKNRYRIEDINENIEPFLRKFTKPKAIYIDKKYNSWGEYKQITLNDIPQGQIKDKFIRKMKKYGYQ